MSGSRPHTEVYNHFSCKNDTQKYKNEEFKDSEIFTMVINDHDA